MLLIAGLYLFHKTRFQYWGVTVSLLGLGCLETAAYVVVLLDGLLFRGWML